MNFDAWELVVGGVVYLIGLAVIFHETAPAVIARHRSRRRIPPPVRIVTDIDHSIRNHSRDYQRPDADSVGRCSWVWRAEDVTIDCWHPDLPGTGLCLIHSRVLTDAQMTALLVAHSVPVETGEASA